MPEMSKLDAKCNNLLHSTFFKTLLKRHFLLYQWVVCEELWCDLELKLVLQVYLVSVHFSFFFFFKETGYLTTCAGYHASHRKSSFQPNRKLLKVQHSAINWKISDFKQFKSCRNARRGRLCEVAYTCNSPNCAFLASHYATCESLQM